MTRIPSMTTTYKPLEITENRNGDITQVEYHNATPDYLFELSKDTTARDLYRNYAASGLIRFCLDVIPSRRDEAHLEATQWASRYLLNVRDGFGIGVVNQMPGLFRDTKPNTVSGIVDEMSIIATASNRPSRFREIIESVVPETEKALIIAIGHGGILAAADTHIAGVGEEFYPVRYSQQKRSDKEPILSEAETEYLKDLGKERTVIILDEDCTVMMRTLCTATEFFANTFGKTVFGATAAHLRGHPSFSPAIITSDKQMLVGPLYPGQWGGNMIG